MGNSEMLERAAEVNGLLGELAAARRGLRAAAARAEDAREQIADLRVSAESPDGLATVICDGDGKVQRVELDTVRYNGATEEQVCAAVLAALAGAREEAERAAAAYWRRHAAGLRHGG